MSPYDIEECCEAYRKQWLSEVMIYVTLMLISGVVGFCFGVAS